jgi:alkylation response protein AidB-like acyl-CoA dehydrogenase
VTDAGSDDEVRQLRHAVRGTLGVPLDDAPPVLDAGWRSRWSALAELGVTALCVPEARGGFGLQVGAAVGVALELGAALHGSPYAGLVASAHALGRARAGTDDPVAADVLGGILAGTGTCAFGRLGPDAIARLVDGAPDADALLLLDPPTGDLVLVADPAAWTVEPSRPAFDLSRTCGDVTADLARGVRIGHGAAAGDLHRLLLAADALGGVQRALDRTVAYAGQRLAFGRPIGGFQAVQHRLVDHAVRTRGLALAVADAARLLEAGSSDAARAVVLAELGVSRGAVHVLHDLLQLTGAVGFTWEHGLHLHERRAHHDARLAGNPRAAARALAELEGWTRAG